MNSINFEQIQLSFSLNHCKKGSSYEIEFTLENTEPFHSELIKATADKSLIEFSKVFLCDYHFSKIQYFKVNIKRWKNRQHFINIKVKENLKLTLSTLVSSKNAIFQCEVKEKIPDPEIIIIKVENPNYSKEIATNSFTLFDYLKAGIILESYIGIDFTNGTEHIPDMETNQYMQSVAGIRETLFDYIRDFQVYGYGAGINNSNEFNNLEFFNLSLNDNPILTGYTNIENAYSEILNKISFYKSSSLSPLIIKIKNIILSKYRVDTYNILFLLISNAPEKKDFQKCLDALIEATYLPLSIVIIGIGNNELEDAKKLFLSKNKFSSRDIEKRRNNVSFISMKDCNFNNDILKNKCLKDIPIQIVEYYKINNTTPDNIREKNLDNIRQSFKILDNKNSLYEEEIDVAPPPSFLPMENIESNNNNNFNNNNNNNINNNNINIKNNINNNNIENNNNNNKNDIFDSKKNDIKIEKQYSAPKNDFNSEIKKSNNYINGTPEEEFKKDYINALNPYSQDSQSKNKEKKYAETPKGNENPRFNEYRNNPYASKPKENKNNNNFYYNNNAMNNIEKKENDKMYNNTPKGQETQQMIDKPKPRIDNPYCNRKNNNDEDVKKDSLANKINNINNKEEKKYLNKTPGNQEINNFNNINNPYKKDETKLVNETPNPDNKKFQNNKIYSDNPFLKKNLKEKEVNINVQKKDPFPKMTNNNNNYNYNNNYNNNFNNNYNNNFNNNHNNNYNNNYNNNFNNNNNLNNNYNNNFNNNFNNNYNNNFQNSESLNKNNVKNDNNLGKSSKIDRFDYSTDNNDYK